MALSENYRTETIGRSDCRPIVRLSADTIVRWDYRPNPTKNSPEIVISKDNSVTLHNNITIRQATNNLSLKMTVKSFYGK